MSELGTEAFRSAVAGVASVLALTLVLEARHTMSHSRLRGGRFGHVIMAFYFLIAEALVFAALVSALMRLDDPNARAMNARVVLIVLTGAFALAVFVPLLEAFTSGPRKASPASRNAEEARSPEVEERAVTPTRETRRSHRRRRAAPGS